MAIREFRKDEVIFRQGDEGEIFYQVIDGSVGLFACYDGEEQVKLAAVSRGGFFGEMAVIDAAPRTGTAIALEDGTRVQEIAAEELNTWFREKPENISLLMKALSKRLRELTAEYDKAKAAAAAVGKTEKEQDEEFLRSLKKYSYLHKTHPVQALSAEKVREEKSHSEGFAKNVEKYSKGTVICKEGDLVACMYDIHWGRVGIYSNYGRPDQVELTTFAANNFFGEMGMIEGVPRSATAVALDDGTTVEIIYPEDFAELFEKNPSKVEMIVRHLSGRLRQLTAQYYDVCGEIAAKTK